MSFHVELYSIQDNKATRETCLERLGQVQVIDDSKELESLVFRALVETHHLLSQLKNGTASDWMDCKPAANLPGSTGSMQETRGLAILRALTANKTTGVLQ